MDRNINTVSHKVMKTVDSQASNQEISFSRAARVTSDITIGHQVPKLAMDASRGNSELTLYDDDGVISNADATGDGGGFKTADRSTLSAAKYHQSKASASGGSSDFMKGNKPFRSSKLFKQFDANDEDAAEDCGFEAGDTGNKADDFVEDEDDTIDKRSVADDTDDEGNHEVDSRMTASIADIMRVNRPNTNVNLLNFAGATLDLDLHVAPTNTNTNTQGHATPGNENIQSKVYVNSPVPSNEMMALFLGTDDPAAIANAQLEAFGAIGANIFADPRNISMVQQSIEEMGLENDDVGGDVFGNGVGGVGVDVTGGNYDSEADVGVGELGEPHADGSGSGDDYEFSKNGADMGGDIGERNAAESVNDEEVDCKPSIVTTGLDKVNETAVGVCD
ncbi:hypothetical protein HDU76_008739 [Blyttiomyces sp. JEL0837]|nr:hypothetical protein HDU76_008739 [Blyttiomyces sp. JEL0837]